MQKRTRRGKTNKRYEMNKYYYNKAEEVLNPFELS